MRRISDWLNRNSILISFLIIVVFFGTICVSQLTFAQDLERSDGSTVVDPMVGNVLWDQSDNTSDSDIVSQDFIDVMLDIFDARAADDFLVPEGSTWTIDIVKVFGTFDANPPDALDSLDVVFFVDEGGFPGELIDRCNYTNIQPVDVGDPSFQINLPTPCQLLPGTYWVSVRANMLFELNGQWFWNERTIQNLNPFVWENPGNGFGTGCTTFSYAQAECDAGFPDLLFQILGQEHNFPAVPTLSTWGLLLLAVAFGLVCAIYSRKMRKRETMGG